MLMAVLGALNLSAQQDTFSFDIVPCEEILDADNANQIMAEVASLIQRYPWLFEEATTLCDRILVWQLFNQGNAVQQQICDSLRSDFENFPSFYQDCLDRIEVDSALASNLGLTLCDTISACQLAFVRDSIAAAECDTLMNRPDFEQFANDCDSIFQFDTLAIQRLAGSQDPRIVESVVGRLSQCDTLLYCRVQEELGARADSILRDIAADTTQFLNDCDQLIFRRLGEEAWRFTPAERIIMCNYLFNELGTTPAEIAEECGITEDHMFSLATRYSQCLRQARLYSPIILETDFGGLGLMAEGEESQHGSRTVSLGFNLSPGENLPRFTLGANYAMNTLNHHLHTLDPNVQENRPYGLTTTMPLGEQANDLGLMLMIDQQFSTSPFTSLGYELRGNLFSRRSEIASNGYLQVDAMLSLDEVAREVLQIDLCGFAFEIGGWLRILDLDQSGQMRVSRLLPNSLQNGEVWGANIFGFQARVSRHF